MFINTFCEFYKLVNHETLKRLRMLFFNIRSKNTCIKFFEKSDENQKRVERTL